MGRRRCGCTLRPVAQRTDQAVVVVACIRRSQLWRTRGCKVPTRTCSSRTGQEADEVKQRRAKVLKVYVRRQVVQVRLADPRKYLCVGCMARIPSLSGCRFETRPLTCMPTHAKMKKTRTASERGGGERYNNSKPVADQRHASLLAQTEDKHDVKERRQRKDKQAAELLERGGYPDKANGAENSENAKHNADRTARQTKPGRQTSKRVMVQEVMVQRAIPLTSIPQWSLQCTPELG